MDGSLEERVSQAISKIQPVRAAFFRRSQLIQDGVVLDDGPTLEEIKAEEKATKENEDNISAEEEDDIDNTSTEESPEEENEVKSTEKAPKEESDGDSSDGEKEEATSDDADYNSMTVVQLKELLKEAGKPVSGKKADLISRLSE